jgi:hypothetical protein
MPPVRHGPMPLAGADQRRRPIRLGLPANPQATLVRQPEAPRRIRRADMEEPNHRLPPHCINLLFTMAPVAPIHRQLPLLARELPNAQVPVAPDTRPIRAAKIRLTQAPEIPAARIPAIRGRPIRVAGIRLTRAPEIPAALTPGIPGRRIRAARIRLTQAQEIPVARTPAIQGRPIRAVRIQPTQARAIRAATSPATRGRRIRAVPIQPILARAIQAAMARPTLAPRILGPTIRTIRAGKSAGIRIRTIRVKVAHKAAGVIRVAVGLHLMPAPSRFRRAVTNRCCPRILLPTSN